MPEPRWSMIFEPINIGSMRLKNRLVCPPMVRNYGTEDGFVTQRTIDHYERIAKGGAGLLIVEATCVDAPVGKAFDFQLLLDDDKFIPGFARLARAIHRHGAKVAVQLHHAGQMTHTYINHVMSVAPSDNHWPGYDPARSMSVEEIRHTVLKFGDAAERAKQAGIDAIEIHGAHFYLLSQFLSLALNRRQDAYGGTLENRARFLIEVMIEIKGRIGKDFPVWSRLDGQEFGIQDGLTIEESRQVAAMLEKAGADAIHVSGYGGGDYTGYTSAIMYDPPGNFVHLAESVKSSVTIPVIAVGKIPLPLAEDILSTAKADLVAMGRGLLADPDLPQKAMSGRPEDIRPCLWCRTCGDWFLHVKRCGISCQVNATLGHEREYRLNRANAKKKVLVIGGGPAGMEVARVAALRGHEVALYEREPALGGQAALACVPPGKTSIADFINYLAGQLNKLKVSVNTGVEMTAQLVADLKPDVAVIATGAQGIVPKIKGIENTMVVGVEQVLRSKTTVGQAVAIIGGGMVGCEVADYLSDAGKKVTIVEMLPQVASSVPASMRIRLLSRLAAKQVGIHVNARCREITDDGLFFLDGEGILRNLKIDSIVLAAGSRPNRALPEAMKGTVSETYLVGDCVEPGRIIDAVSDGFRVGRKT